MALADGVTCEGGIDVQPDLMANRGAGERGRPKPDGEPRTPPQGGSGTAPPKCRICGERVCYDSNYCRNQERVEEEEHGQAMKDAYE